MSDPLATTPQQITERVVRSFDGCPDDRLRDLMQALAGHLHAFASEVGLTGEEWRRAIAALTRSGELTDERRQEFVLWSDALGLSMLVDALEHSGDDREKSGVGGVGGGGVGPAALPATESTVLGPFYVAGAPRRGYGESIATKGDAGEPVWVHGYVRGTDGEPIAGAELDIGRTVMTGCTRSDAPRHPKIISAAVSRHVPTAASGSWRCARSRIRSPMTARSARCCGRPAGNRGVRPTST